jgi:hypothetical protein
MERVCILAAGSGTRLYPLTQHVPKHLVEIHGRPLLHHIVDYWKPYCQNFIIIVSPAYVHLTRVYMSRMKVSCVVLPCDNKVGTADALDDTLHDHHSLNTLFTWCDLYPTSAIDPSIFDTSTPIVFTSSNNNARYMFSDGSIRHVGQSGNVTGMYYVPDYTGFPRVPGRIDVCDVLFPPLQSYEVEVVDVGDTPKYLDVFRSSIHCRSFNNLERRGDTMVKKTSTPCGREILHYEHQLYLHVKGHPAFPRVVNFEDGMLVTEYLEGYTPLYLRPEMRDRAYQTLEQLHTIETKPVSRETFIDELLKETVLKIYKRRSKIEDILEHIPKRLIVNGVHIISFEEAMKRLLHVVTSYTPPECTFHVIHGDPNFGNILVKENDVKLIDPRGFFGSGTIYGPKEYDQAKFFYGLSGYDSFHNDPMFTFELTDNEITFDIKTIDDSQMKSGDIRTSLMVSLWLALPQYLETNYTKLVASYYHSLYLATLFLPSSPPG